MRVLTCFLLTACCSLPAQALTTRDLDSGGVVAIDLVRALFGPDAGLTFSNVKFTGDNHAAGLFSDGLADGLGVADGIILSTGRIADAVGPNRSDGKTFNYNNPGDADLESLVSGLSTRDAVVLEFEFIPRGDTIRFEYVFASEEYNDFVGARFNDVFAFFLNGQNIARIGGAAVSINTVNKNNNNDQFNNNAFRDFEPDSPPFATEFDGFTHVLTAEASVTPNEPQKIKLAIADGQDSSFDSAVFIRRGSFNVVNPTPVVITSNAEPVDVPTLSEWAMIMLSALMAFAAVRQFGRRA